MFVEVPYWHPYSTDKFICCIVPGSSQWFLHFGEDIVIAWTQGKSTILGGTETHRSSWQRKESHRCCCHGPLEPLTMENSGTSPVLIRYDSMRLLSLRQSERTTARAWDNTRDELIRAMVWSILNINKDGRAGGARRLPNIWQKMINKGETILKVYKCCTPVNKAMSEVSFCHNFSPNSCIQSKFEGQNRYDLIETCIVIN